MYSYKKKLEGIPHLPWQEKMRVCVVTTCCMVVFCPCNLVPKPEGTLALLVALAHTTTSAEAACFFCGKNAMRSLITKLEPWMVVMEKAPAQIHMSAKED